MTSAQQKGKTNAGTQEVPRLRRLIARAINSRYTPVAETCCRAVSCDALGPGGGISIGFGAMPEEWSGEACAGADASVAEGAAPVESVECCIMTFTSRITEDPMLAHGQNPDLRAHKWCAAPPYRPSVAMVQTGFTVDAGVHIARDCQP